MLATEPSQKPSALFLFIVSPSVERACSAAEAVGCPGLFHKDSVQPQGKCFSSKRLTEADLDTPHPPPPPGLGSYTGRKAGAETLDHGPKGKLKAEVGLGFLHRCLQASS